MLRCAELHLSGEDLDEMTVGMVYVKCQVKNKLIT